MTTSNKIVEDLCDVPGFDKPWDYIRENWPGFLIHWNLSVTTTSIMKFITCDLFSNVF